MSISLVLRNLVFIFILPAAGAVYGPWWIVTQNGTPPRPVGWPGAVLILIGIALYLWCVLVFATSGFGTPAPWDGPRRLVVVGPYRFVRNPIYVAAFLVIGGEATLLLSLPLVLYLAALGVAVHVYVLAYEEPRLYKRFGEPYEAYRRSVPRWIPRLRPG